MTLRQLNNLVIVLVFVVTSSIAWDVFNMVQGRSAKKYLQNYIPFELKEIESARQKLISQIKTSISFKNPKRRNRLDYLSGFENHSIEVLEDKILIMHPTINTLDSLPYGNDEISKYRELMNMAKNEEIKILYKELLKLAMLETLASDVYDDSDCGFYNLGWEIIRPISNDSTYIGSMFYADGRSKYAYQINGIYFEGLRNPSINGIYLESFENYNIYTIPKSDTLNIYTIMMHNAWTKIDTTVNNQRIRFDGKKWRSI
ncbi:MAG: hypothetical protein WBP41_17590 [Saprospiraceae bacterium]